jgi:polysaccharide pyruvyl transferase WcaK-like protein
MKIASERSASISVRGEYSAEVLAHYGIDNVTSTGCPSLVWNLDASHRVAKPQRQVTRVALNCSRGRPDERLLTRRARRVQTSRLNVLLPRLAFQRDLDFVAQAELPDIYHALGRQNEDTFATAFSDYLARIYGTTDTKHLNDFFAHRMKVFFDVEAWLRYLTGQHLVFGTRLHGAIAGLLAGTPAVLVTHDARTAEMARQASVPSVSAETVTEDADFRQVYDACDIETFNRNAPAYYRRFAEFFDANGLRHRLAGATESTHGATQWFPDA